MPYFIKVIPPSGRARIHDGDCKFCCDGQGMENQDKGTGPTYWYPKYPQPGLPTLADAKAYMGALGYRYKDTGLCSYCMKEAS